MARGAKQVAQGPREPLVTITNGSIPAVAGPVAGGNTGTEMTTHAPRRSTTLMRENGAPRVRVPAQLPLPTAAMQKVRMAPASAAIGLAIRRVDS